MSKSCGTIVTSAGRRVDADLAHGGVQLVLVAEAPRADLLAAPVLGVGDVRVLARTWRRAERWKTWPMTWTSAPLSRDASIVGTQRMPNSALPPATTVAGTMSTRARQDRDVEALLGVEALVQRGEVARELGLGEPLQLEPDGVVAAAVPPAGRVAAHGARLQPRPPQRAAAANLSESSCSPPPGRRLRPMVAGCRAPGASLRPRGCAGVTPPNLGCGARPRA